jgi:hypothetical protein
MALSNDYPATAIAGIFGATQEARAAKEAMRILNESRQEARVYADRLEGLYTPLVKGGQAGVDQARSLLTDYLSQTQALDVGNGLTGADERSYKDASRLLNENMVATGNLRSGAAAYSQSELMSRVVANAQDRSFNRNIAKLNILFGGASAIGQQGLQESQVGTYGMGQVTNMRNSILGFGTNIANAELRKGGALSNQITSVGAATDEVAHTVIDAFKAYATGGMSEGMSGGTTAGGGNPFTGR